MPNPLAYLRNRILGAPITSDYASDANGISGQGALYDDAAGSPPDDDSGASSTVPLPSLSNGNGAGANNGSTAPISFFGQGQGQGQGQSRSPGIYDRSSGPATSRASELLSNPPNPNHPAWWRTLLGTLAQSTPLSAPFAQDIKYGGKQADAIEKYQRELPGALKAAELEQAQQKENENALWRQIQQGSLAESRAQREDTARAKLAQAREDARTKAEEKFQSLGAEPIPEDMNIEGPPGVQIPVAPPTRPPVGPTPPQSPTEQVNQLPSIRQTPPARLSIAGADQIPPRYHVGTLPESPSKLAERMMMPPSDVLKQQQLTAAGKDLIDVPESYQKILGPKAPRNDVVDMWKAELQAGGKNVNDAEMYLRANNNDPKAAINQMHRDKMAERSVNNINFGQSGGGGLLDKLTRQTTGGHMYIDGSGYAGKQLAQLQSAAPMSIPVMSKDKVDLLEENEKAKMNLDMMLSQIQSKLPKDAQGRTLGGALQNQLSKFFQTDEYLASVGTFRNAAVQLMRAVAGSKGLRINQYEVQLAVENDIPKITDTVATAQRKVSNMKAFLENIERATFNDVHQANVGPKTGETRTIPSGPNKGTYTFDGTQWVSK